jgi:hypothetical protein
MRINVAIPESHVDAPPLDAALEAVTRLNETMLKSGEVTTAREGIKRGVLWKPEPPGDEHFDHAKTVSQRGWGDCDDLAPWHAASLRHTGEDEGATAIVQRSGPQRWHAVVKRSDGSIDDPSREAGMGRPRGVQGAWLPVMSPPASVSGAYIVRPQIALRPIRGGFQARADMPWHWREHLTDKPTPTDYAMTALHTAPVASTALVGACHGASLLGHAGGFADPEHVDRLCAIADACEGMSREELAEIYGREHAEAASSVVGSFFGSLARAVTAPVRAVSHIIPGPLKGLIKFIPGVGPVAAGAMDIADHLAATGHPNAAHLMRPPPGAKILAHPAGPPQVVPGGAAGVHMHCVPFS